MEDEPQEEVPNASAVDEPFLETLLSRLVRPETQGLSLSPASASAMDASCPTETLSPALLRRLDALADRATVDLEFQEAATAKKQPLSLGRYLTFLRQRLGLSLSETAARYRLDFQMLGDLERDGLAPAALSGRRLALLLKRLGGSLEQAETLVATLIRVPRQIPVPRGGRLFRAAPGAGQSEAAAASRTARGEAIEWQDNPAYAEEVAAVERVIQEMRQAWRGK